MSDCCTETCKNNTCVLDYFMAGCSNFLESLLFVWWPHGDDNTPRSSNHSKSILDIIFDLYCCCKASFCLEQAGEAVFPYLRYAKLAYLALMVASSLAYRFQKTINFLIELLAGKQKNAFQKMLNFSFKSFKCLSKYNLSKYPKQICLNQKIFKLKTVSTDD